MARLTPRNGAVMNGVRLQATDSALIARARAFLGAGPAESGPLVAYVCQLPNPPRNVAERLATALLASRDDFRRTPIGLWDLSDRQVPTAVSVEAPACLGDRLHDLSYVVVDVETTGTRAYHGDRVTEIAAVVARRGAIVNVYETLVNPERPIPPYITALTRITWDMVKRAPRFAQVEKKVRRALEGHVFVAHNVAFDWRFVSAEFERASSVRLDGRRLCTVRLARKLLPQLARRSLDQLARYYGVEITARHRAGGDAVATAHVLFRLLDEAADRGIESWDTLQQFLLAEPARRRRRRHRRAMPTWVDRDTTA